MVCSARLHDADGIYMRLGGARFLGADDGRRRSEEQNRAILRAIPDRMFILSTDGMFFDYHAKNPAALLVPPEEFLGKPMHDMLPPWLAEAHQRAFERAPRTKEPERIEYSMELANEQRSY